MKKSILMTSFVFFITGLISATAHAKGAVCDGILTVKATNAASSKFTIDDAKAAAIQCMRNTLSFGVKKEDRIGLQKKNSKEYTTEYLKEQMGYIGSGNRFYKIYGQMLAEKTKDSSLQIFSVFLTTGSGDSRTQDIFTVRLKTAKGQKVFQVSQDD